MSKDSIADLLRAALTTATQADAQKHALAKRLYAHGACSKIERVR